MPIIEPKDASLTTLKGIHLWHDDMSSCSQRVRAVLALKGLDWESHLVIIPKRENTTPEYLAINPAGLVPVLNDNGVTRTESMDIIDYLDHTYPGASLRPSDPDLAADVGRWMQAADEAQYDQKVLSHEFLFRIVRPIPPEELENFEANVDNDVLVDFMRVYAAGDALPSDMVAKSVDAADAAFRSLDQLLDGRDWLVGDALSLADIAWMPNAHRFELIDWPLDRYPNVLAWHARLKALDGYAKGIVEWEPAPLRSLLTDYVTKRAGEGHHVRNFGVLAAN